MADPLSVLGAVAVAIHAVRKTKSLVDPIKRAPEFVKHVSSDLRAVEHPLQELSSLSESTHNLDPSIKNEISKCLCPALDCCQQTSDTIRDLLLQYVTPDGKANRSVWKRVALGFKEQKVEELQNQLAFCKDSLSVAVVYTSLLVQAKQSQQARKIERGVKRIQKHFAIPVSTLESAGQLEKESQPPVHFEGDGQGASRSNIERWLSTTQRIIAMGSQGIEEAPSDLVNSDVANAPSTVAEEKLQEIGIDFTDQPPLEDGPTLRHSQSP